MNITGIGDNLWKTANVTIHDQIITQNCVLCPDFMLVNTDSMDDIFHGIEVDITRIGSLTSIDRNSQVSDASVYPNPTSDAIHWNKNIVSDEIVIYNSKGQIVSKVNHVQNRSLSLINLEKGIYFVVFFKEKQRVLTKKVIKE
jgi:hypothetical protein